MGWSDVLRAMWRRWYIIVAGILATGGLALAAWHIIPPIYQAEGTILLLPSKSTVSQGGQNPFLNLDSLTAPAALVIARLDGEAERSELMKAAPTAKYSVDTDPTMRGPTILVTVTDKTATSTLDTLNSMLDTATQILSDIQKEQNVPSDAVIGSMRLTVDSKATRVTADAVRVVVATAVTGVVVTLALAVAIDAWVRHRAVTRPSRRLPKKIKNKEKEKDDDEDVLDEANDTSGRDDDLLSDLLHRER
ncbi:hypothetical protein [Glutamicibacter protophormiae]|uniref:hypothetical protein n=1 Tax=Glutamicibacter protophormiae TaxID=37930 RepID=UPI003A94A211